MGGQSFIGGGGTTADGGVGFAVLADASSGHRGGSGITTLMVHLGNQTVSAVSQGKVQSLTDAYTAAARARGQSPTDLSALYQGLAIARAQIPPNLTKDIPPKGGPARDMVIRQLCADFEGPTDPAVDALEEVGTEIRDGGVRVTVFEGRQCGLVLRRYHMVDPASVPDGGDQILALARASVAAVEATIGGDNWGGADLPDAYYIARLIAKTGHLPGAMQPGVDGGPPGHDRPDAPATFELTPPEDPPWRREGVTLRDVVQVPLTLEGGMDLEEGDAFAVYLRYDVR